MGYFAHRVGAYEVSVVHVARFAYLCSGIFAGFFFWSFYPQKIMPGYAGGTLAGYLLGFLSLLSYTKVGTLGVVLAIPITDACYVMTRRVFSGKSPLQGDAGHFHHRLLAAGWGRRRISLFYLFVSLLFGSSLLFLETTGEKLLAFFSVFILLGLFIWILQTISQTAQKSS
ncbi:MAG: putative undecaprenyl-phosphate N-acetylglucosaminyl 1-phosphate transferase [Microgenomates bacterium OLB22]|nr:MAG: putative undecaprenyl-phosphate N-acetylglucosaminyl 1-phosphate transferase [Microgenomates bacterium OLB22]